MTLKELKTEFAKYIILRDDNVLDMIFATIVGNLLLDKDPIWLLLVAPSSGGKTTITTPALSINSCFAMDDMTEKSLLSGYKGKGKEVGILRDHSSGIFIFSDFTSILTKNKDSRDEILGQLKLVYDGSFTKYTGLGKQIWNGKIGIIAASTPDIYQILEAGRSLGERFIYYWMDVPSDKEIANKQKKVKLSGKAIVGEMKTFYSAYFEGVKEWVNRLGVPEFSISEKQQERIERASMFCVLGKATVHTDYKTGKADALPNKAGIGRDNKMFEAILHSLQIIDAFEAGDWKKPLSDDRIAIVERCAYSSINRERRMIMEIMAANNKPLTASQIGSTKGLGLDRVIIEKYLIPLNAIGLVRKHTDTGRHKWSIVDEGHLDFIHRVAPGTVFEIPEEDDEPMMSDADKEFEEYGN